MPIAKYFKGHGEAVMQNMMKQYGAKKGKSVFYATANKQRMMPDMPMLSHMPKGGTLSPHGDLGELRQAEGMASTRNFFKGAGKPVCAASAFKGK